MPVFWFLSLYETIDAPTDKSTQICKLQWSGLKTCATLGCVLLSLRVKILINTMLCVSFYSGYTSALTFTESAVIILLYRWENAYSGSLSNTASLTPLKGELWGCTSPCISTAHLLSSAAFRVFPPLFPWETPSPSLMHLGCGLVEKQNSPGQDRGGGLFLHTITPTRRWCKMISEEEWEETAVSSRRKSHHYCLVPTLSPRETNI